jgi:single stranded DNA-binding protein (ssb)
MSSYNKVIIMGHLTRDPEIKRLQGKNCVLSFSVGINKKYRDGNGEMQDRPSFPNCVAWNRTTEFIEQYFAKGDPIHIEGELQTRSYKDKDDKSVYVTEVFVQHVTFAGGTRRSSGQSGQNGRNDYQPQTDYGSELGYPGDDHPGFADTPF